MPDECTARPAIVCLHGVSALQYICGAPKDHLEVAWSSVLLPAGATSADSHIVASSSSSRVTSLQQPGRNIRGMAGRRLQHRKKGPIGLM